MKKIYISLFLKFLGIIFLSSAFFSCYKKDFDNIKVANATPQYLYPIVDASLTLKDIVDPSKKKLNVSEDADGFYTFVYYQDVFEKYISDFLKIQDLTVQKSLSLTNSEMLTLPVSGSVVVDFSQSTELATTNGEKLKIIKVKSGTVPVRISSTFNHDVEVDVTFPFIKKNGIALTQVINLLYQGTTPNTYVADLDLTGYTIDCSEAGTKVNALSYTGKLHVNYKAGSTITSSQKLNFTTGISSVLYSYIEGYIGKYTLEVPIDTVSVDIFNNAYLGNVYFTDPKVRAIITNSIGAPAVINLNKLTTLSNIGGKAELTGTVMNTDLPIMYPSLAEVGQGSITKIQLDRNNSNVQTIFNPTPNKVIYKLSASINPDGESNNFITDESSIKLRGEVEIPMEGKITNFVLLDTIEGIRYPDLDVSGKTVSIKSAGFNIALSNGFPMNSNIQLYFYNKSNVLVDSLFTTPHFIPSGTIDNAGKVIHPTNVLIQEVLTPTRYDSITTSTKAVLVAQFSTSNNGTLPVKIYSSYKLKSNISLDIKANVVF